MFRKKKLRDEVVYVAQGILEAESIKIFLESYGIPSFINQESAGLAYGLTVGALGAAEILVQTKFVEEAKKAIKEMEDGKLDLNSKNDEFNN